MNYPGFLIKRERLLKNWSQEGLCKGICAVSYLSKIEQGKAEASEEIISALFERLGIDWVTDEKLLLEGKKFVEDWYEA
ncbi:MAG: helix-turn-helix transcriptional regulator, partial [Ruminococcaceae bacterium]|nr:helix-turn-helix transcriptional regulator [Oscillospiraceae bacterium]